MTNFSEIDSLIVVGNRFITQEFIVWSWFEAFHLRLKPKNSFRILSHSTHSQNLKEKNP